VILGSNVHGVADAVHVSVFPAALQTILLIILLVATAVWIGGWFSLIVIARSTTATLEPTARVAFFRHFGRVYGTVSTTALFIALAAGLVLLIGMPWTALSTWLVIVSLVLLAALGAGVLQARRLTRQRHRLVSSPEDAALAARIATGSRRAIVLRASLGVISILILVLGVLRMT